METVEALDIAVALTSDWLSNEEELELTPVAFAMGTAASMELGELIDEGIAAAEGAWAALTVSVALLLQVLPPSLDTRHLKSALLSVELTCGRFNVAELAPEMNDHEDPESLLLNHWNRSPEPPT